MRGLAIRTNICLNRKTSASLAEVLLSKYRVWRAESDAALSAMVGGCRLPGGGRRWEDAFLAAHLRLSTTIVYRDLVDILRRHWELAGSECVCRRFWQTGWTCAAAGGIRDATKAQCR
jgi:hypothetical protein